MKQSVIAIFFCSSIFARYIGPLESWTDYTQKLDRAVLGLDVLEHIDPNQRFGPKQYSAPEVLLRESMQMNDDEDSSMPLAKISWLLKNGFRDIDALFLKAAQLGQVEEGYSLLPLSVISLCCLHHGITAHPTVCSDEYNNNALHYTALAGAYLHDFPWIVSYLVNRTRFEHVSADNSSGYSPYAIYRECCRQQQREMDSDVLLLLTGMAVAVPYPEDFEQWFG